MGAVGGSGSERVSNALSALADSSPATLETNHASTADGLLLLPRRFAEYGIPEDDDLFCGLEDVVQVAERPFSRHAAETLRDSVVTTLEESGIEVVSTAIVMRAPEIHVGVPEGVDVEEVSKTIDSVADANKFPRQYVTVEITEALDNSNCRFSGTTTATRRPGPESNCGRHAPAAS